MDIGASHGLIGLSSGEVLGFGSNSKGQLGVHPDAQLEYSPPIKVLHISTGVAKVACGQEHSLVLSEDGNVWSFGNGRVPGLLGRGNPSSGWEPELIPLPGKSVQVSCGPTHSLILLENGEVLSFGSNLYGALGVGGPDLNRNDPLDFPDLDSHELTTFVSRPVLVPLEEKIIQVACGTWCSAFLSGP